MDALHAAYLACVAAHLVRLAFLVWAQRKRKGP